MAKNEFYTVKKTINGVEYTAQFNGLSFYLKTIDENYLEGSSNLSSLSFNEAILENVIVNPAGLTPDSFKTAEELAAVIKFGKEVMQGKFCDKK